LIRPTEGSDCVAVMEILRASGQFDADSLAFVQQTLDQHLKDPGPAIWLTADEGEPVGVAYCAPEPVASETWNLLMLFIRGDKRNRGVGKQLVSRLETELQTRAARLLIVETSGLPAFAVARSFYPSAGFKYEATIKSFYAAGDDKLVFTKPLTT